MLPLFLNGKFTAQRTTGVQRVARQLVEALDGLPSLEAGRWCLLCPRGAALPTLGRIDVRPVGITGLPLHVWEQAVLPRAAARGLLVNLAGGAPWFARRQVCLLHDAAVFDHPEAYSPLFVAWYRALFRRLARRGGRLLTVSEFSRRRLADRLNLHPGRIGVLPNGADHLDATPEADAAAVLARHGLRARRYLLAVGSANPTKNHAMLVDAYRALPPDPQRRLVIVGTRHGSVFAGDSGGAEPADRHADQVLRIGDVDDASLKTLYRHAVALVFPSLYEGFGLPPLEAMGCGCPVAASGAAAVPEICGDAALYFDPHDRASITAALQRLLTDDAERQRLRSAGLLHAARWRWADAARRLQSEVLEAADAATPSAGVSRGGERGGR